MAQKDFFLAKRKYIKNDFRDLGLDNLYTYT